MTDFLTSPAVVEAVAVLQSETLKAVWETVYSTFAATALAYLIGLPLGVLLVVGERDSVRPLPGVVMHALNAVINLLRSVPFLILMIIVLPLSRLIIGTSIGTPALIPPLVIAAFPFVARMVESSLRETDKGVVEAALSMGASPLQVIAKVMLPEALPSLINGATIALTTILGYGAMAGIIGGGGLGSMAISYGYYRFRPLIMWAAVVLLIILVQIFQSVGTRLSSKSDKRISKGAK